MAAQSLILSGTSTPAAVAGSIGTSGPYHGYIRVRLKSIAGTAYLGDSGVTTAGYPLTSADSAIQETLAMGETLWMASSSGATVSLAILRLNETT
jgi:hypothetical protein